MAVLVFVWRFLRFFYYIDEASGKRNILLNNCVFNIVYIYINRTMSTGKKVSKKPVFPTSFDLSTVFKGILWMETNLQNDQNLIGFSLSGDLIEAFQF